MLGCSPAPRPDQDDGGNRRRVPSTQVDLRTQQPSDPPPSPIRLAADFSTSEHLPSQGDWDTEIQGEAALRQLQRIATWIDKGQPKDLPEKRKIKSSEHPLLAMEAIFSPVCEFWHPRSERRTEVLHTNGVRVFRGPDDELDEYDGWRRFLAAAGLWKPPAGGKLHVKFKLYRIEPGTLDLEDSSGSTLRTRVRVELSEEQVDNGPVSQTTSTWDCEWWFADIRSQNPKLLSLKVSDWEQVQFDDGPLFRDVTQSVMAENESYISQMLPGIPHWLSRLPKEFLGQFGHHGMAVGDVNGDGLDDIYVCDAGGLPNRLYVQQDDGTVIDASASAGVDFLEDSSGVLIVDLDNDGDQDLVVSTDRVLLLCENDGHGKFSLLEPVPVDVDSFSLSAADYDNDGDLDLYVCVYEASSKTQSDRGLPFPIPYHDANNGGRNLLLRNEGAFRFVDVTDDVGLGQNNSRFSMASSWEDFDNDGDQDLYVANDFGRNCLYRNEAGRFTDVAAEAGVEDHASGMSVSCGDFDRNGDVDIYVGNMFSAAGNRVTYQRRFVDRVASRETTTNLQRMARGNSLFRNNGNMRFSDTNAEFRGPAMGRWAWASPFVDFTNDGWLDVVVANGYVTNEDSSDL